MSQVTKPIALDETLQDVVTAIQGITQGGMIVSTGTVGSATQPVYINGGVPTGVNQDGMMQWRDTSLTDCNTAPQGWMTGLSPSNAPFTGWLWLLTYSCFWNSNNYNYTTQFAFNIATNDIYTRVKNNGTWGVWKRVNGSAVSVTIASSGWTAEAYTSTSGTVYAYKYEVTISELTADSYVDGDISSGTYTSAWCVESASGKIVIRTATQPNSSLTFRLYYQM